MDRYRKIFSVSGKPAKNNGRPTQPLNGRIIKKMHVLTRMIGQQHPCAETYVVHTQFPWNGLDLCRVCLYSALV